MIHCYKRCDYPTIVETYLFQKSSCKYWREEANVRGNEGGMWLPNDNVTTVAQTARPPVVSQTTTAALNIYLTLIFYVYKNTSLVWFAPSSLYQISNS
jgi:hypothetical protein